MGKPKGFPTSFLIQNEVRVECDLESIENALFIRRGAVLEGEEAAVEISDQNFPGVDGGQPRKKKNRPGKGGKVSLLSPQS